MFLISLDVDGVFISFGLVFLERNEVFFCMKVKIYC